MLWRKETWFRGAFTKHPRRLGVAQSEWVTCSTASSLFLAGRGVILCVPFHMNQEEDPRMSPSVSP